jgi:hypothetical protein
MPLPLTWPSGGLSYIDIMYFEEGGRCGGGVAAASPWTLERLSGGVPKVTPTNQ